jgi:hypothetical protein
MMALPIGDSGSHFSQPAVDNLFNGVKWIQSISPSRQRAMERWNWELGTWQAAPLWFLPQCHCSPPLTSKNGGLQPNFKDAEAETGSTSTRSDEMRLPLRVLCAVCDVDEHNMVGVLYLHLPYAIYLQQGQAVSNSKRIRCPENPAQASLPAEDSENGSFHQWLV